MVNPNKPRPVSSQIGERRRKSQAGKPGVKLVHPRYLRSSTYCHRDTQAAGTVKLCIEVTRCLSSFRPTYPRRRVDELVRIRWADNQADRKSVGGSGPIRGATVCSSGHPRPGFWSRDCEVGSVNTDAVGQNGHRAEPDA